MSTFLVRVCAIVGGIYAVSSIFESLLRNSINIFGFGGFGEDHNLGTAKSTMKRPIGAAKKQAVPPVYGSVETNDDSVEMSEVKN